MYASILVSLLLLSPALPDAPVVDPEQLEDLPQYFGFEPYQIYKLHHGLRQLRLADLDGDGRTDILVWNPYRSRFELFYQRAAGESAAAPAEPEERNELPDRGDLRRESVPASYNVAAAEVAELTGDEYPDIVFFGEPRELVIMPGRKGGGFGAAQGIRAPEGRPRTGSLAVGDFNHDGRSDVALLGDSELQLFMQKPRGGLAKPMRLVHGITNPMLMLPADVDGDGREDLLISADEERYGAYVAFSEAGGGVSALRPVRMARTRSVTIAPPLEGQVANDIFTIDYVTGRLQQHRWGLPPKTGVAGDWPQRWHSYPLKASGNRRPVALGDVTGDGLPDCCAADPEAAQIILFPGKSDGLGSAHAYPGLLKVTDVCVRDLDADGRAEVLVASPTEQMVGLSRYEDGRLTFPTSIGTRGKPYVVAVDNLHSGGPLHLAYVTRDDQTWRLVVRPADNEAQAEPREVEIKDLPDDPAGLLWCDLDQDGRNDLLLLLRYGAPRAFLQADDGTWSEFGGLETRAALLKEATPTQCLRVDVTGDGTPELLMSQGNVVRALRVSDGRWSVVDQYNPETANAEITGLTALPGKPGSPTLVMYERRSRELLVQERRSDNTYGVTATIPLDNFDLTAMATIHIGPQLKPAVVLADAQKLAVVRPEERAPTLVEQRNYTSEKDDAWLGDSIVGDLNHDGVRDVVVVDMNNAALELLTTLPDGSFARALRFQVFQGKRFADAPDSRGQPREVLVGDVTSDGTDDIVLIVHDRLIVYPGQ